MTTKELLKNGYYHRHPNLEIQRIFAIHNQEFLFEMGLYNNQPHCIIEQIDLNELNELLNLFFNSFPDLKVKYIAYLIEENALYFSGLSKRISKEEKENFNRLFENRKNLKTYYTIRFEEFLKVVASEITKEERALEQLRFLAEAVEGIEFHTNKEVNTFFSHQNPDLVTVIYTDEGKFSYDKKDLYLDNFIKENGTRALNDLKKLKNTQNALYSKQPVKITEDVFLIMGGRNSYLQYNNKRVLLKNFLKAKKNPFSKEARLLKELKDCEIDIRTLTQPLQNKLISKNVERIRKKQKELLYYNYLVK